MDTAWGPGFNLEKEYLKDKRVRQALMYALDLPTIVNSVGGGDVDVWDPKTYDPSGQWFPADLQWYSYDPEKAKALLKEAAWDSGRELQLITYYVRPLDMQLLAAVQQYWDDVGVKVNVVPVEGPAYTDRTQKGDFDIAYAWQLGDGRNWATLNCANVPPEGKTNLVRYCNADLDAAVDAANSEPDPAKRKEHWTTAAKILADELPATNWFTQIRVIPANKNVCNWRYYQYGNWIEWQPATWYLAQQTVQ